MTKYEAIEIAEKILETKSLKYGVFGNIYKWIENRDFWMTMNKEELKDYINKNADYIVRYQLTDIC